MSKKIPLTKWAEQHYDPPPSLRTLRAWARSRRIQPEPELTGREYRVSEDAVYVPPSPVLGATITVIESQDSVVNAILRGKTEQHRSR